MEEFKSYIIELEENDIIKSKVYIGDYKIRGNND